MAKPIANRITGAILALVLSGWIAGCLHDPGEVEPRGKPPARAIAFDGSTEKLPWKIILPGMALSPDSALYLILQDYYQSYSHIVKFHVPSRRMDTIHTAPPGHVIREHDFSEDLMAWAVFKSDSVRKADLYAWRLKDDDPLAFRRDLVIGDTGGGWFPSSLTISGDAVHWLEHDDSARLTRVRRYNTSTQRDSTLSEYPYLQEPGLPFPQPVIYLASSRDRMLFTLRKDRDRSEVVLWDLNTGTVSTYDNRKGIVYNYAAAFNDRNPLIALYGSTGKEDLIYTLDLSHDETETYIGFTENALVFGDRIRLAGSLIYYVSYLRVTGYIKDAYKGEIYDTRDRSFTRMDGVLDFLLTEDGRIQLRMDEKSGPDVIHLEMFDAG